MKDDIEDKDTTRRLVRVRTQEQDARSASAEVSPLLVLLAEDDADMREALAAQLSADGYSVKQVSDGSMLKRYLDRALAGKSSEPTPDLVISDIQMPGQDGLQVLEWLRGRDWTIPIILVTAFGDDETHGEAERLGVTAILDKPFEIDQLRATIEQLALTGA